MKQLKIENEELKKRKKIKKGESFELALSLNSASTYSPTYRQYHRR